MVNFKEREKNVFYFIGTLMNNFFGNVNDDM